MSLLQSVTGIGKMLSLVLLYEIHRIECFPRVQDFASDCRQVKCSQESGGKRLGTSGAKIGNAPLKWAFSEAATLFLRHHEAGQTYLARLETQHDKGQALSILAHQLARAVYSMLKRKVAFDRDIFLRSSGSRAAEPEAELDSPREEPDVSTPPVLLDCVCERHRGPRPLIPEPNALIGQPLWLLNMRRPVATGSVGCPSPEPGTHWRETTRSQAFESDGRRARNPF